MITLNLEFIILLNTYIHFLCVHKQHSLIIMFLNFYLRSVIWHVFYTLLFPQHSKTLIFSHEDLVYSFLQFILLVGA